MEDSMEDDHDRDNEEEEVPITEEDEGVEEQVDKFFAELDIDHERKKRRLLKNDGGPKTYRRKSTLPAHLHQVMGSANLSLARGDTAAACDLCLEVIRQAPYVVEPFLTLATIYEDTGARTKLLQILLIAANLKRSDHDLWIKVADLATELQQLPLATQCLSKAFRFDSHNFSILWRKGGIFQELLNWKKAIETYEQLKQMLPKDENFKEHVEVAKELARVHHIMGVDDKAIEVLQEAKGKYPLIFDDEAANFLTELLISSRMFTEALNTIISFYKIPYDVGGSTTSTPLATPTPTDQQGPLSLSAALSMSMSTSDVLDPLTGTITGPTGLTGSEREEVVIRDVPESLPIDLRSKLSVCLIHLHYMLPENILSQLTANPEQCGDLLLDVSEAHMENVEYPKALPLLTLLTETNNFNQAGVWLKHGECLHMTQELEQAVISYAMVLSLAPHHTETRMTLASLYSQLGMTEEALELLDADEGLFNAQSQSLELDNQLSLDDETAPPSYERQSSTTSTLDPPLPSQYMIQDVRLLHTKFNLLVGEKRVAEYIGVGGEMLTVLFRDYIYRKDLKDLFGYRAKSIRYKIKSSNATEGPEISRPPDEEQGLKDQENHLSKEEWWGVFEKTCNGMYCSGKNKTLLYRLVMCADVSKKFESFDRNLYIIIYQVCLRLQEYNWAFHFLRAFYFKKLLDDNGDQWMNMFWTLFNKVLPTTRQQKFVLRQMINRHPGHPSLLKMSGNYSMIASSYKFALAQYEMAYKQDPDNYALCLSIAVVYCNISLQKHSLHRNTLVTQCIGFLHKYRQLRGECQETSYNIGRLFHQLGLIHIAIQHYKKVLTQQPDTDIKKQNLPLADLSKEAAFNLSLIYRKSGNSRLAIHYLTKYCTI